MYLDLNTQDTSTSKTKLMRKLIIIIASILVCFSCDAQQQVQYTQFLHNKLWINPAYAGSHGHGSLQAIARNQWAGLDGAPKTAAISFHTPFEKIRTGYGLTMTYDEIGPTTAYSVGSAYSYNIWKKNNKSLHIGLQAHYTWWQIDFRNIETTTSFDEAFQINPESLQWLNFGFGIYYESDKGFFGFSAPTLMRKEFFEFSSTDLQSQFERHWYLIGGHVFRITENIELNTGGLIKYVHNAPIDLDINGTWIFDREFWAGLNLRMGNHRRSIGLESFDLIFQYQLSKDLRLGLAYDFTLSDLDDHNNGTFELLVHWELIKHVKNVRSLRYF